MKPPPKNALVAWGLERTRSDALVVPLTVHLRKIRRFAIGLGLILVGSLAAVIFFPAAQTIGGAAVLWLIIALLGAQYIVNRRRQMELVISDDAVSTPFWMVPLDRIERLELGHTSPDTGGLEALFIKPYRSEDVTLARSAVVRLNARLNRVVTRDPSLRILQVNVEPPLPELAGEIESRARRSLR